MSELSAQVILKEIEKYVNDEVSIIDALIHYCDKHDVEVEVVGELVKRSPILKSLVYQDAEKLNLTEKTARLPI